MKIQVVGSKFPPEYAGAGFRIVSTYKRLAARGAALDWNVITSSTEFPGNALYVHQGIAVERIATRIFAGRSNTPTLTGRALNAVRAWIEGIQVWRALSKRDFDLLHVFGTSGVTAAAILFAAIKRKPIVIELVTAKTSALQSLPGLRIASFLRTRLTYRCLVVAISQALADRCAADGLHGNVWTRPNPVDTARFFPEFAKRSQLRVQHTPFATEDVVLGMVAKFMPQKNQLFLIDVLAKLPERYKLVLAGPLVEQGPLAARDLAYVAALRQRIADTGCAARVHMEPEFVPAEDFIKLSDVYLLPNINEGLATPMLESLACGVPVVGNASEAAFRQWISDGENGFLCPLDPAQWAQAIERAVALPQQTMIAQAEKIAGRASAEKIDDDFFRLISALPTLKPDARLDVDAVLKGRA